MDELCFCSIEGVFSCLVDKTKISLPVLITAFAFGYIWTAKKQIREMKKQCSVLEDDMNHIKRENYQLGEEIRRIKCAASDTELLNSALNKCCIDRSRPQTKQCSFPAKTYDTSCQDAYRCISRKMKKRKSRKASSPCEGNSLQLISYSTPEVFIDSPIKTSPKCKKEEISRFEWSPKAESTKIDWDMNKFDCNDCDLQNVIKQEKVSFCDTPHYEPKTKKCRFDGCNYRDRSLKSNRRSKSPEPILQSFDCYRYVQRTKPKSPNIPLQMCKSDLMSISCNSVARERKCTRPSSRRNPCQKFEMVDNPFLKCENRCKSPKKNDSNDCCPRSTSRSMKLKEKIEKYRNEISRDLNSFETPSDCTLCHKDKLSENESFDLTRSNNNCNSCEFKQYSFKKWEKPRCR